MFFSRNTKEEDQEIILEEADLSPSIHFERYLGLPALIGRSRIASFNSIKGRIWSRINGWKEKFISHAGKEILLKAVIQSIPTYTMLVFRLPKTLVREINVMMSKFWWRFKENTQKISWMDWQGLGRSKNRGGLGFRELESFNSTLLAKQWWRLIQFPNSLAASVIKGKYYSGESFMDSNLGKRPSFAWRSIWGAKDLIQEGVMWKVGGGSQIKIWGDKWVNSVHTKMIQSTPRILDREEKVQALIDQETSWWNIPLVEQIFSPNIIELICSTAISPRNQSDMLIWSGTSTGLFSVRSAYHLTLEVRSRDQGSSSTNRGTHPAWSSIWRLKIP